ncbi:MULTISPECIES: type II toxin-antitoxin system HicB family antitoxin [Nitrospirillum]|uniref:Antitoxin HicB n=1 Tax=Nitrospirillum amazonense TaxID=28077 RepID=A0A560FKZ2_9PROT|nr:type II toxin-antitoxin system HicB family antitoxin [Nitrospirillum amazonense]MEC4590888.1 type II toxin-antitoxin system HicB family antitoxin [Nitrospirillum amazonense]TWB22270.1 antitoxin HicB [Nitrospirillum amazonense]
MRFPITIEEDGGVYIASAPDLPGVYDQGDSIEEAVARLRDAAVVMIGEMIEDGDAIPDPSPVNSDRSILIPSLVWAKVLVYRAMRAKEWRRADLQRAMGVDKTVISRLLNVHHASRMDQIDQALAALGVDLDIRTAA